MNIFSRLQNIGTDSSFPEYVNDKIQLANVVAFFNLALVAIPFTFISYLYVPEVVFIPILGVFVLCAVWILNWMKVAYISRVIVSVSPLLLASAFTASVMNEGEQIPVVLGLVMLVFSLVPFLVFDVREKAYLFLSVILNLIVFLGTGSLSFLIDLTVDTSFITSGILYHFNYTVSILLAYIIVFMMAFINYRSEVKSQRLIADNKKQTANLHESENVLKANLEEVRKSQEEEKNRAWATEGLGRINSLTRQYDNPEDLSTAVMSEIVKYVEGNQGALYLVEMDEENEEPYMEMKAAFAFGRKKAIKDRVKIGEGLIGQCYLEKDMIYLTEVPDDFVRIKSGLGDAPPKNIVIMPLMTNENIEGVLEVASFQVLPDYKIEYLKKLGESLATAFSMNKINANTKKLLELSQEQEEQMRSQAEELHQNMEELQATQEEMARKNRETEEQNQQLQQQEEELRQTMEEMYAQTEEMESNMKEMEKIQAEMKAREEILNESTIVSESDIYGTITYANDKLVQVAKYSREEMLGKPHSLFRHPEVSKKLFKALWDTIKAGEIFRGVIKNRAKDGSTYWVDAIISPVLDKDGKPEKYIAVRYVIENSEIAQKLYDEQMEMLDEL